MKYTICPKCEKVVSNSNIKKHLAACGKDSSNKTPEGLTCQYCHKIFKNYKSLVQHEIRCASNPARLDLQYLKDVHYNNIGRKPWNKALTKDLDARIAAGAAAVKETLNAKVVAGWKPEFATDNYWTADRRTEKSKEKIQFFKDHPEKHPNRLLAGNRDKLTYIEQIAYRWLKKKTIEFVAQYETVFKTKKRFVDFYVPAYNLYIELDGYYWHQKRKELDIEKDKFAIEVQHIKTLRLSGKDRIETKLEEYFQTLTNS